MSQSAATKLIPRIRFKLRPRRNLKNPEGPAGRHNKIKKTLTALLKHERIELNFHRGDEVRGYAERLISEAIRNGDTHQPTMEMASYWIIEPQIIHKLFKVLAPRYATFGLSYTKMWRAPNIYPGHGYPRCVLELRNNIYPSLEPDKSHHKNLIHNVLLEEAKKVYRKRKAELKAAEEKLVSEGEQIKSEMKENVQAETKTLTDGEAALSSKEMLEVDGGNKNEVSSEENLEAVNTSESEVKSKSESIVEDLSKLKISEDKPVKEDERN